jgi:hypothetical protein
MGGGARVEEEQEDDDCKAARHLKLTKITTPAVPASPVLATWGRACAPAATRPAEPRNAHRRLAFHRSFLLLRANPQHLIPNLVYY